MIARVTKLLLTKLSTNLFTALPQASSTTLGFAQNLAKNKAHALPFSSMALSVPNIFLPFKGIAQNTNNLLVGNKQILIEQNRSVVKFSWKRGTRKGIWIRTIAGRNKKLWKKSGSQKNRLKQHVFCNATQTRMLDTMVSKYWRKPKYYIEDPYEIYYKREGFSATRRKPWRPEGCDYE